MAKINPFYKEEEELEEQTIISTKYLGENYKNWPSSPPITLHWENLNVSTQEPNFFMKKIKKKEIFCRRIIKNVNGIAKPGSLLAIMGASGAGKTTLLNVLNMKNGANLQITGDVKINGIPLTSTEELSSIAGYVQQEDLFIGYLKVKEQLRFQAHLKMNKDNTSEEKEARVEQILIELNLKKAENTLIGDPDRGIKGISGGERRRLSVGCELITNPSLIFFDEPTSGLDSYMALMIVDEMNRLARNDGHLAFFGDLDQANRFFTNQGFPVPINFNPADHYINTLATKSSRSDISENNLCVVFQESEHNKKLNYEIGVANDKAKDPYYRLNLSQKSRYKVNCITQFSWLLWRTGMSQLRDPMETTIIVIQTFVIAVILGLIFLRLNYDQPGIQNINGVLFLLIANTSFSYVVIVINTFTVEIPIFLRENKKGMYMVISYYLAKVFVDLPKFIILPLCLTTIVYWMTNLNYNFDRFVIACVIIVLVANTSVAFGGFLSAVSPSYSIALNLTGPILPPLMIFSGYFLNNKSTPPYCIWLKYLSWFNYSNELLNINQWQGVKNITCDNQAVCLTTGNQILEALDMKLDNYSIDFVALVIIFLGYRTLTFVALLIRSYRK